MTRGTAALLLAATLLAPAASYALHRRTPLILQVTPGDSGGVIENPRWAGYRYVVFESDADLLTTGSASRQLFLFDLKERDLHGLLGLHQLTQGPGDPRRPSVGRRGKKIAFDGLPGGAPGPRQLFVFDRRKNITTQLTVGLGDSTAASLDDSATVLVFQSSADFFGTGLTGTQIYRIDLRHADLTCPYPCPATGNRGLTQITAKSGINVNPATSKVGLRVVFESDADPLASGENETQIYCADLTTGTLHALTHGPGASHHPTISRSGGQAAFESDADLFGNGSTGTQIFLYERLNFDRFDTPLRQITAAPAAVSSRPSLSSNGRALTFVSTGDLLGVGSTGPEVFSYDVASRSLTQVTDLPGDASFPAYSDGVFTTFVADGDLLGTGTTGPALYLVNLFVLSGPVPGGN